MRCCKEQVFYGYVAVPSLDTGMGRGSRKEGLVLAAVSVVLAVRTQHAEPCRTAQGGSKGESLSISSASGGSWKETAANPRAAGPAVATTVLLAESQNSGHVREL